MSIIAKEGEVAGEFIGHSDVCGFAYEYHCKECKRYFRDHVPTLSKPIICPDCYNGKRSPRGDPYYDLRRRLKYRCELK